MDIGMLTIFISIALLIAFVHPHWHVEELIMHLLLSESFL